MSLLDRWQLKGCHDNAFLGECNGCVLKKSEKGEKPDHTEFMVLAGERYDVYLKSLLGFANKKSLGDERLALVCPTLVST